MGLGASISDRLRLRALRRLRRDASAPVQRTNRAARIIVDRIDSEQGIGPDWSPSRYGEYFATSASVHAAVRVRADAVARPPLVVFKRSPGPNHGALPLKQVQAQGERDGLDSRFRGNDDGALRPVRQAQGGQAQGERDGLDSRLRGNDDAALRPGRQAQGERDGLDSRLRGNDDGALRRRSERTEGGYAPAGPDDPLQALLDRPNPVWSRGELWRSTEANLLLWGSAYWGIETDPARPGRVAELWPLRPDRVRVLPDQRRYVKGFVYESGGERVGYLAEEMVWFRHLNPLEEFSGMSSVAPARLAVDMAAEALRFNRNFFANSAVPGDVAVTTQETPTDAEVAEFYERWDSRFRGAGRAHRPVLLSRGMDVKRLGLSHRDMEWTGALRWTVDEVSRAFGVPKVFLAELEDATLANVESQERFLWRNTVVPELRLLEDAVNRSLAPLFDEFPGQRVVRFDLGSVEALQESENDRVDRLVKLVRAGVITAQEAREG